MKKHKLNKDEMKGLSFHLDVIKFHDLVIKNYLKQITEQRLKIKGSIKYNLEKGEVYEVEKIEKIEKK